jgi:hypothetical protein
MENNNENQMAKLMLEMDLKSQSGSIWTDEKTGLQKEKTTIYQRPDFGSITLDPDPVYYNGEVVDRFPPQIVE